MPAATASAVPVTIPSLASLKAAINGSSIDGQIDISALFVAEKPSHKSAAKSLAATAQKEGPAALQSVGFTDAVVKALANKKSSAAREGAVDAIRSLIKSGAIRVLEPTFIDSGIYAALLETFADKMPAVRTAAVEAVREFWDAEDSDCGMQYPVCSRCKELNQAQDAMAEEHQHVVQDLRKMWAKVLWLRSIMVAIGGDLIVKSGDGA